MKTIENGCREYLAKRNLLVKETDYSGKYYPAFKAGVEFAQQYTSVEDKFPDALKPDDLGIFYSDYLLIKVRGYEYPFVGYYVKAEDDEFFDFIQDDLHKLIKQEAIIGWRLIEIK